MNIQKEGDLWLMESSEGGKFYEIDLKKNKCSCPQFKYRLKGKGECKHIRAVKDCVTNGKCDYDMIVEYVRKNVFVDSVELIEKFGDVVDELVRQGELIEEDGKIRLF